MSLKTTLIATAALLSLAGTAVAEQAAHANEIPAGGLPGLTCGVRGEVVALLKNQFSEEQEEIALQSDHALMELFASERGTWSILLSSPNGTSCVVAAGKGLVTQAKS